MVKLAPALRIATVATLLLAGAIGVRAAEPAPASTTAPASAPKRADGGFELDREKAGLVWDAEHITFKLETYVNKPLMKAWSARDEKKLSAFFHEDATFRTPKAAPSWQRRETLPVAERRWERPDLTTAERADALSFLMPPPEFRSIHKAKMRVLYLDRVGGSDLHWKVRFWHEAEGRTAQDEWVSLEAEYDAEVRFSVKEDIDGGQVISAFSPSHRILRRGPGPLFQEVTESAGLSRLPIPDNWALDDPADAQQYRFQMAVEDFDLDGFPDIAIATVAGPAYLLRSIRGERFVDVASQVGLIQGATNKPNGEPAHSIVAWIDYDNDGDPDLLLGKHFYRNDEGKFVDVSKEVGWKADTVPLGVNVADYDRDGRLDLYIAYQRRRTTRASRNPPWIGDNRSGARNELLLNRGGKFEDQTVLWGAGGGDRQTFAAATFYLDDDLWPDLYLANDFAKNVVLQNLEGAEFVDVSEQMGAGDFSTSMGVAAGDLTGDGRSDVYVANMYSKMGQRIIAQVDDEDYPEGVYEQLRGSAAGSRLYTASASAGDGDDEYDECGQDREVEAVGWAYAPALADVDGDGWLDIYATTGFMSFDRSMPDG